MKKIQAFYEAGGAVIATGQLPSKSAEFNHDADVARAVEDDVRVVNARSIRKRSSDVRRNDRGGRAIHLTALNAQSLVEALDGCPVRVTM